MPRGRHGAGKTTNKKGEIYNFESTSTFLHPGYMACPFQSSRPIGERKDILKTFPVDH